MYSLYRLLVLLGSLGIVYLLGMRGWWWLLISVAVAAAVAYLALPRPRAAAAAALAERATEQAATRGARGNEGIDEAAEDAVLDLVPEPSADDEPAVRPAPPQGEGEREPDHELEAPDVPQDAHEPRT